MAVCFKVHAKFGDFNRAPRFTLRVLLKPISTVVGSVRGGSLFKHTTTTLGLALISRIFLRNFGPFSRKKIFAKYSEI
jgi:hypothetical protein